MLKLWVDGLFLEFPRVSIAYIILKSGEHFVIQTKYSY